MKEHLKVCVRFVVGLLREKMAGAGSPAEASCSRVCAIACCAAGIIVALRHPDQAATVAALIGGGTVALLTKLRGPADG